MLTLQFILDMEAQLFDSFLIPFVVCPLAQTSSYQQVRPLQQGQIFRYCGLREPGFLLNMAHTHACFGKFPAFLPGEMLFRFLQPG